MITSITSTDFVDAFRDMGRQDNFSYSGLRALFDYFEDYSEDTGESIELDVIAICCEYSEHDSALACVTDQGYNCIFEEGNDEEENEAIALEYLRDNTQVIEFEGGIIIADF